MVNIPFLVMDSMTRVWSTGRIMHPHLSVLKNSIKNVKSCNQKFASLEYWRVDPSFPHSKPKKFK